MVVSDLGRLFRRLTILNNNDSVMDCDARAFFREAEDKTQAGGDIYQTAARSLSL